MFKTSTRSKSNLWFAAYFASAFLFLTAFHRTTDAQKSIQIFDDEMQAKIVPWVSPEEADAAMI